MAIQTVHTKKALRIDRKGDVVKLPQNIHGGEAQQRRNFFRLDCHFPIQFKRFDKNQQSLRSYNTQHCGLIRNLSGGGVKLVTECEMEEKDFISFNLNLDGDELFLMGEVKINYGYAARDFCGKSKANWNAYSNANSTATRLFQYGVMFNGISVVDQDKIVRYLFRQQKLRVRL